MKSLEIVLALVAGILAIVTANNWKELKLLGKISLAASIITLIVAAINTYHNSEQELLAEKINARYGDIKDLEGATIPTLEIGYGGAVFIVNDGVFGFPNYGPLLKIYLKDGRMIISTIIRNRDGEIIAMLDENTWHDVDESKYEYNNDKFNRDNFI